MVTPRIVCSAVLVIALAGCSKASASDAAATTGSGASTPPASAKKPKATLNVADAKAAYNAEFHNPSTMRDSLDKKIAAVVAKIGQPPSTDDGRKKVWYALDGDGCSKVVLDSKDGSFMDGTTDKSDCGL